MRKKYIFESTSISEMPYTWGLFPALFIFLLGVIASALFPFTLTPESRIPIWFSLGFFISGIWFGTSLFIHRSKAELVITPDSIQLFSGAGSMALPGEHGDLIQEIRAEDISSIECKTILPASKIARRREQIRHIRQYRINYRGKQQLLNDRYWKPELTTISRLDYDKDMDTVGEWLATHKKALPGLFEAFQSAGYKPKMLD